MHGLKEDYEDNLIRLENTLFSSSHLWGRPWTLDRVLRSVIWLWKTWQPIHQWMLHRNQVEFAHRRIEFIARPARCLKSPARQYSSRLAVVAFHQRLVKIKSPTTTLPMGAPSPLVKHNWALSKHSPISRSVKAPCFPEMSPIQIHMAQWLLSACSLRNSTNFGIVP